MKTPADYLAAAHANTMPATWCAARVTEIRAHVNTPDDWVPYATYRTWLVELLSQLDAEVLRGERAVQAVIDNYDPLPGKLEPLYRAVEPAGTPPIRLGQPAAPGQPRAWCYRCGAMPEHCDCEQPPL